MASSSSLLVRRNALLQLPLALALLTPIFLAASAIAAIHIRSTAVTRTDLIDDVR